MNYLAVYNGEIRKLKRILCKRINSKYLFYMPKKVMYSRYDYIYEEFRIKILPINIKVNELEKGIITITFSMRNMYLEENTKTKDICRKAFEGLKKAFDNNLYLDIKKEFLTITDSDSLNTFFDNIYVPKPLDNELGQKLLNVFKKTTMYENIYKDYKNFAKNYEKTMKNSNHEIELFKIKFLNTGELQILSSRQGKERKRTYDNFESIKLKLILENDGCFLKISNYIDTQLETFWTHL